MQILNISGYKFIQLSDLESLKMNLQAICDQGELKGTILLSTEGMNLNLAGNLDNIKEVKNVLKKDLRFSDMSFRESYSRFYPFNHMKVKIKKEIITMRHTDVCPSHQSAPYISPDEFKAWMDEGREITILDTRNEFEVLCGTFRNATHLGTKDFSEFPKFAEKLPRNKPIVMFCTGGIRCEKASSYLLNEGFADVYQLEGGILNYFAKVGGAYFEGDCFVFDQRIALDTKLQTKE